jgi:hypothetical protein
MSDLMSTITDILWKPGHELTYVDVDARCSCGDHFRSLAEWVLHERDES